MELLIENFSLLNCIGVFSKIPFLTEKKTVRHAWTEKQRHSDAGMLETQLLLKLRLCGRGTCLRNGYSRPRCGSSQYNGRAKTAPQQCEALQDQSSGGLLGAGQCLERTRWLWEGTGAI